MTDYESTMTKYGSQMTNYGSRMTRYGSKDKIEGNLGGNPTSHIPAHELLIVAAPFRA